MQHPRPEELARRQAQRATDRILRDADVRERTGLSRTTRWRLNRRGKFPAAVPLTERAIGWRESEIAAWIDARSPKAE